MLQRYCINNNETNHKMNSEETTSEWVEKSHKKDKNPPPRQEDKHQQRMLKTRKRDFVSKVFKDTGFICEV